MVLDGWFWFGGGCGVGTPYLMLSLNAGRTPVSSVSRTAIPPQPRLAFSPFASHQAAVVRPRFVDYIKVDGSVFAH